MYKQISDNKIKSALLLAVFFAIIVFLGWWLGYYFETGPGVVAIAVIIAILMSLTSYYKGDAIALATARATAITAQDDPYVYHLVENTAITAGLPMPKVYLINDPALNAFSTGRDPQHASIAITTGLVKALENEELEGVVAHELSHVKNFDIRLATVVIVCVGIITLIADFTLRGMFWGGRRSSSSSREGNGAIMIIGLILLILSPIFAQLIQLAISRKREFLADASGALLTRYPEGLARALEKIGASETPLRSANRATAHLYIADPFNKDNLRAKVSALFSTHPPLAERIKRLRNSNG